jgi:soluble lytic murein transglycosylase-like protein
MYLSRGLGASTSPVDLIASMAPSYGVPPSLALAVAQKESNFNQAAVGSAGEIGVFQLMPGTARDLGVNPSDLNQNVQGGLSYLSQLYNQLGDWTLALEAYNGGASHVTAGTVSSAAKSYAQSIMDSIGNLFNPSPAVPTLEASTFPSFGFDLATPDGGLSGTAWIALGLAGLGLAVWAASA